MASNIDISKLKKEIVENIIDNSEIKNLSSNSSSSKKKSNKNLQPKSVMFDTISDVEYESRRDLLAKIALKLYERYCGDQENIAHEMFDECPVCDYVKQFYKNNNQKWKDIEIVAEPEWVQNWLDCFATLYIPGGRILKGGQNYNDILTTLILYCVDYKERLMVQQNEKMLLAHQEKMYLFEYLLTLYKELPKKIEKSHF